MTRETKEDLDLLREAAQETELHHAKKKKPGAMFGPKPFHNYEELSAKPAPAPKGPPTDQLLEDAKRRRREREREENDRG